MLCGRGRRVQPPLTAGYLKKKHKNESTHHDTIHI